MTAASPAPTTTESPASAFWEPVSDCAPDTSPFRLPRTRAATAPMTTTTIRTSVATVQLIGRLGHLVVHLPGGLGLIGKLQIVGGPFERDTAELIRGAADGIGPDNDDRAGGVLL